MSGNAPTIDQDLNESFPNGGTFHDEHVSVNDWILATGAVLGITTGTSAAYRLSAQDSLIAIRWEAGATAPIVFQRGLPGSYDAARDRIEFIGRFRQAGATTANLAVNVNGRLMTPGKVSRVIADDATPAAADVTAADAAVTAFSAARARRVTAHDFAVGPANILSYCFDLSFDTPVRLAALGEIGRLKPLSILQLTIAPSGAPAASCNLDFFGGVLRFVRNAAINPRDARFDRRQF